MLCFDRFVFLGVPLSRMGGVSNVMLGVNHSCVWGCILMLGVLASIDPIHVSCELSKKYSNLAIFFSVFSVGWVACLVVWVMCG